MSKIEVDKIVLRIGEKEIELSLEEAKELQEILSDSPGMKGDEIIVNPFCPVQSISSYPISEYKWRRPISSTDG